MVAGTNKGEKKLHLFEQWFQSCPLLASPTDFRILFKIKFYKSPFIETADFLVEVGTPYRLITDLPSDEPWASLGAPPLWESCPTHGGENQDLPAQWFLQAEPECGFRLSRWFSGWHRLTFYKIKIKNPTPNCSTWMITSTWIIEQVRPGSLSEKRVKSDITKVEENSCPARGLFKCYISRVVISLDGCLSSFLPKRCHLGCHIQFQGCQLTACKMFLG